MLGQTGPMAGEVRLRMNGCVSECVYTFSSICFCYHGQPIHRSTHQLHVIQVDPAVVTCQYISYSSINKLISTLVFYTYNQ